MELKNKIICGDVLDVLKTFSDESIDMVITSPPYYGLRNYGVDRQLGLEPTFEEFVKKFLKITAEFKRVLKTSGSFWMNFGDCYGGERWSNSAGTGPWKDGKSVVKANIIHKKIVYSTDNERMFSGNKNTSRLKQTANEKCLLMQPERIAIKLIDQQGWILRNKIKWCKQIYLAKERITKGSVMPTSVRDRFNESGEELYFFVKNKKYYSDLDAVRLPNQVLGVTDFRASGFIRTRELYPNSKYRQDEQYMPFSKQSNARQQNAKKQGMHTFYSHSERNKVNDPRGNHEGGPGSWRDFKDSNPNDGKEFNPLGKNLPSYWLIGSEPHNFQKELGVSVDHFATFPQALLEIPIKFACPPGGIVLDPFIGSGTTALVAKKLNRNYVGIDLNPQYIEIAEKRLNAVFVPITTPKRKDKNMTKEIRPFG